MIQIFTSVDVDGLEECGHKHVGPGSSGVYRGTCYVTIETPVSGGYSVQCRPSSSVSFGIFVVITTRSAASHQGHFGPHVPCLASRSLFANALAYASPRPRNCPLRPTPSIDPVLESSRFRFLQGQGELVAEVKHRGWKRLECSGVVVGVDPSHQVEIVVKFARGALGVVIMGDIALSFASTQEVCCVSRHRMRRECFDGNGRAIIPGRPGMGSE